MTRELPVWRSLLYVPAHVERFVEKAHLRGADGIQLDLEDAVPASEKEAARAAVERAAGRVRRGGADVLVRINAPLSLAVRDLEASVGPDVDGFIVSKVRSAAHVELLDELIGELEQRRGLAVGHSRLIALVESAAAWPHLGAIARASPRIAALNMGAEDFALDCGMEASEETLLLPKQQLVQAAAAAQVLAIGLVGSMTGFADRDAFRALALRSRRFGFSGSSCIHPGQVAILNEAFSPSPADVDRARRIVDALDDAGRRGLGAVAVDGRMVDAPIAMNARRVLARDAQIAARAARLRDVASADG